MHQEEEGGAPPAGCPLERGNDEATADPLLDSVNRVTSMCPNCEENGETLLLLHRVPHFKDLLISSFSCPHCNYSNREVKKENYCKQTNNTQLGLGVSLLAIESLIELLLS